jgi:hypothetical protein
MSKIIVGNACRKCHTAYNTRNSSAHIEKFMLIWYNYLPMVPSDKKTIGRAEALAFPELGFADVYARIDTGARTSAIWVSQAVETTDGKLAVVFFGEESTHCTGETIYFEDFDRAAIASSTGHIEERYRVRLLVKIGGRRIRGNFTLADRSTQVYPVLIGRNILRGKFIVDVKHGTPLVEAEKQRTIKLQQRAQRKDAKE